ncbi:HNH endonuclease [Teredinibacter purpureus]|uniref:HNH endonuclease n=1 Tax=Teredinibacter purpureus TaxID=2731756 RepID=UPI0005F83130|nr:HNH endonuclease [Teredinibacter purpureus]
MDARILRLNMAGQAVQWLHWKEAIGLYARGVVGWSLGGEVRKAHGGRSRLTGAQSVISLPAIVACEGRVLGRFRVNPALTNLGLFARDNYQCLYCGESFESSQLSRDHVFPRSRGGLDKWENVVAACKRCNQRKGDALLSELSMELLALPYRPNRAEYLALMNNARIRGDQMEYLRPQFCRYSPKEPQTNATRYAH